LTRHFRSRKGLKSTTAEARPDALCEVIKRMGYAQNNQLRLYGEMFDLVSDPIKDSDDLV